jgi:hypothetical protein
LREKLDVVSQMTLMAVDVRRDVAGRHTQFATDALGQMLKEKCLLSDGNQKYMLCGVGWL